MEAAYALLALSNSAPVPSPGDEELIFQPAFAVPSAKVESTVETGCKLQTESEAPHQAPWPSTVNQMSPLAELNCFVAATLPTGDQRHVYNHFSPTQSVSSFFDL